MWARVFIGRVADLPRRDKKLLRNNKRKTRLSLEREEQGFFQKKNEGGNIKLEEAIR